MPPWLAANVVFLALGATALAFVVQSKAQRFTSSIHVALIFAMEPVFAALFSWIMTGEVLTGRSLLGLRADPVRHAGGRGPVRLSGRPCAASLRRLLT